MASYSPPDLPRDKPVALMGAAGGGGSVRAQAALRVPLEDAGAVVLDGPMVALREVSLLAARPATCWTSKQGLRLRRSWMHSSRLLKHAANKPIP